MILTGVLASFWVFGMKGFWWVVCGLALGGLLPGCGGGGAPELAYHLSHHPADSSSRQLRHYPVARQGDLTAWLTSDHVSPSQKWLFHPDDPNPRYPIVGTIRAGDMPHGVKHDGAFLIVSGYGGPLFELWEGEAADAWIFTGKGGWLAAKITQLDGVVNSWVRVPEGKQIGGWSGYPVVIGDPRQPEAIAGAMWYKSNTNPELGGATSTRMLKAKLEGLRFRDFVD